MSEPTKDRTDPETEAMLDGAEIERAADAGDVQHTPRTYPAVQPPSTDEDDRPALTTDPEAQRDDSVINPGSS